MSWSSVAPCPPPRSAAWPAMPKCCPIVLGSKSQPLDVGTSERFVTRAMRRALNVRDKGCVVCGAPPIQCEAHHLIHWIDGGVTCGLKPGPPLQAPPHRPSRRPLAHPDHRRRRPRHPPHLGHPRSHPPHQIPTTLCRGLSCPDQRPTWSATPRPRTSHRSTPHLRTPNRPTPNRGHGLGGLQFAARWPGRSVRRRRAACHHCRRRDGGPVGRRRDGEPVGRRREHQHRRKLTVSDARSGASTSGLGQRCGREHALRTAGLTQAAAWLPGRP